MAEKAALHYEIGERIKTVRLRCGLTREGLAERADISDQFLYEIESGKKGCSAKILLQLSKTLGVSSDFLLTGVDKTGQAEFCDFLQLLSTLPPDMLPWAKKLLTDFVDCINSPENLNKENDLL